MSETHGKMFRAVGFRCAVLVLLMGGLGVLPAGASSSGWYLGFEVGAPSVEARFGEFFTQFVHDDDRSLGIGAGYRVNRFLAFEGWYHDYGEFSGFGSPCSDQLDVCISIVVPTTSELTGFSVRALGYIPAGERLSLYGFAGAVDWDLDIDDSSVFFGGDIAEFSDTDLLYGVGLEVGLMESLKVFVEYEVLDFDVEVPSVGLTWTF